MMDIEVEMPQAKEGQQAPELDKGKEMDIPGELL